MPMKPSRIVSSSSSPNAPYLSYHPRQKWNGTSWHVLAHEFQIVVVGALGIAAEALFLRGLALQSAFAVIPGVLSYGASPDEAMAKAEVLALALCPNSLLAQREQQ